MRKMHGGFPYALILASMIVCAPLDSVAHEYWIDPERYSIGPGERVEARLLVGEMMRGAELPWISHQIRSFTIAAPDGIRDEVGLDGDLPALSFVAEEPGLHIIAVETEPLLVTFDTIEEFADYLEYEGLAAVILDHQVRGLPDHGIAEAYARAAKALVQVGPVGLTDADRFLGLPLEIVALANPYAGPETLAVRLTWQGRPQGGAQLSIFRENEGEVERSLVLTDADGQADFPLAAGRYLLNAVHIEAVDGEEHVWKSTWASLSFAVTADE